jgi:FxLD family lantipeptide
MRRVIEMADSVSGVTAPAEGIAGLDEEFALDVRVVEAYQSVGSQLMITSDNCGSTCSGTACNSSAAYPS